MRTGINSHAAHARFIVSCISVDLKIRTQITMMIVITHDLICADHDNHEDLRSKKLINSLRTWRSSYHRSKQLHSFEYS